MKKFPLSFLLILVGFIAHAQLAAPTLYSPNDNVTGAWTRQDFQWTKVTNATGYTFQIDTTASFDSPLLYEATQNSTSSTYQYRYYNDMRYGTTYYWRVCAINTVDTSGWSDTWQFHTTDCVVLDSPSNDTSSTSGWYTRQEFSWRNSKGSTSYILQLDTTPDFNSPILRSFTKTNSQSNTDTYVSYVVNDMRYGTMHYWRVCAINTVDTSGWSDTWQFHTTDCVVLDSPSNDTSSTSGWYTRQEFSWRNSKGSTSYILQLDTTPDFNSSILRSFTKTNSQSNTDTYVSYVVNDMRYGTMHYWRVCAINTVDTSGWSDTWQFHTTDRVVLDSPSNDTSSTGSWYTRQEFQWRNSQGSSSYILQLDTTPDFNSSVLRSFTKTNSHTDTYVSYVVNDMRYGTTYYWRVCSINAVDTSGWSDTWQFHTTDRVVLNSPSNDTSSTGSWYTRQEFQWRNSQGSSSYILQLDTTPDFNSSVLRSFTKTNSHTDTYVSYVVNDMRYGTTYYWRVCSINAVDTSGWSDTWQFHTTDCVVLNSPSNNTTGTDSKYTRQQFQWYNSRGSSGYILQLDTTQEFNSLILRSFTSTNSQSNTDTYFSYIVNDMRYGTTYYWRVCSINAVDTSGWSDTWQFHTTDHVVLRSPANTSIGMSVSSTQLSWYNSTGSTSYLVQWDTSSTFSSSLLDSYTVTASYTSTADYFYKNITGLRYGTTYYWRVCSANNVPDTSGWSDTWYFTTNYQLTTGPVLTAPANDTIGIPYNSSVAFSWQPIENVQGYYYQIGTSNDFSTIVAQGNTSLTFTSVSNFSPTTTYYWRVRGYNNSGNSVWSQVWHFTTNDVVLTPPVLVSPANDATVQTSNITLTWQSVFGANSYELQFSMDANFATAVTNFTTTGTQYSLTGIPDNTTLYWRVRATNGNTFSDWSAPWHFTTGGCQTSSYTFTHSMCSGESYEFFGQTLTASGDYSQVLTNAAGCDSIVTLHLTVFPTESTEFSETAFDSYTWNGQTYTESGDYTQTLTNIHGCDSIVTLHLTLTVGIDDRIEYGVNVYPNPTSGKLKVENSEFYVKGISIYDVYGKFIMRIDAKQNFSEIDISSYSNGIYILRIETEKGVAVKKVVKK